MRRHSMLAPIDNDFQFFLYLQLVFIHFALAMIFYFVMSFEWKVWLFRIAIQTHSDPHFVAKTIKAFIISVWQQTKSQQCSTKRAVSSDKIGDDWNRYKLHFLTTIKKKYRKIVQLSHIYVHPYCAHSHTYKTEIKLECHICLIFFLLCGFVLRYWLNNY